MASQEFSESERIRLKIANLAVKIANLKAEMAGYVHVWGQVRTDSRYDYDVCRTQIEEAQGMIDDARDILDGAI